MNWYKKAQKQEKDFQWNKMIQTFGLTAILGLAGIWGLNNIDEIKNIFTQNPQRVEQELNKNSKSSFNYEQVAKMVMRHEGKRNKLYKDTVGVPTIGVGFNLNRRDADRRLKNVGSSLNQVLNGKSLTDTQIESLFKEDLNDAINVAKSFVSNFNDHPANVQSVLIDMSFNLGPNRLGSFQKFKKALLDKDYKRAKEEMINSSWYNQVGNRSKELVKMINN